MIMEKNHILILLLCLVGALVSSPVHAQNRLRLMTYNIKHGAGLDDSINYTRTANVFIAYRPDIVAVQEVDSCTTRCHGAYVLGQLSKRTGLYATFAPAINYQGGKYGIGILSKEKPLKVARYPLPGREEERALLIVEMKDFVFACTHLSLTEADQIASVPLIEKYLMPYQGKKKVFLAGDMNAEPQSEFIQKLQKQFRILTDVKVPTIPANAPQKTIDYILQLKDDHFATEKFIPEVIPERMASDHLPVIVTRY